jgi:hypothetical protein
MVNLLRLFYISAFAVALPAVALLLRPLLGMVNELSDETLDGREQLF